MRESALSCEDTSLADEVVQPMELMELKAEPASPALEDALDCETLAQVAVLLENNAAWKDLAQCMGLEPHIPDLLKYDDPAKRLLIGCMVN